MIDNLLVFQKTYDWLLWIKSATERFSKVHKYSLGQQLQIESINLLKKIIIANQQKDKFAAQRLTEIDRMLLGWRRI